MLFPLPKPFPYNDVPTQNTLLSHKSSTTCQYTWTAVFINSIISLGTKKQTPIAEHTASSSLWFQIQLQRMKPVRGQEERYVFSTEQPSKQMQQHVFGCKQTEVERKTMQHQHYRNLCQLSGILESYSSTFFSTRLCGQDLHTKRWSCSKPWM